MRLAFFTLPGLNQRDQLTSEGPDADNNGIPDSTTAAYTYDSNGSQITVTQSAATIYYLWDLRNRMVGISLDNDGNATDPNETTYGYDSNAVRVSQIAYATPANSAIVYLNDYNNPTGYTKALEKKTGTSVAGAASSAPNTTYVLGLRVEGQKDSTSTVWFERDGHGSNRGLIETNATVSAAYGARKRVRLNLSPRKPLRNRLTALDSNGDGDTADPADATPPNPPPSTKSLHTLISSQQIYCQIVYPITVGQAHPWRGGPFPLAKLSQNRIPPRCHSESVPANSGNHFCPLLPAFARFCPLLPGFARFCAV
ncbi:MAG: hypothetical protein NTU53_12015, partial [Planctomycetota bacterium]|nr:hypothetical protein [Planctomycetota bacterium]